MQTLNRVGLSAQYPERVAPAVGTSKLVDAHCVLSCSAALPVLRSLRLAAGENKGARCGKESTVVLKDAQEAREYALHSHRSLT